MSLWKSRFSEKNIFESVLLSVQQKDHGSEIFNLATKSLIFEKNLVYMSNETRPPQDVDVPTIFEILRPRPRTSH